MDWFGFAHIPVSGVPRTWIQHLCVSFTRVISATDRRQVLKQLTEANELAENEPTNGECVERFSVPDGDTGTKWFLPCRQLTMISICRNITWEWRMHAMAR
jgi:hypothetical protein